MSSGAAAYSALRLHRSLRKIREYVEANTPPDYHTLHQQGKEKGFDLPYEDEMVQLLTTVYPKPELHEAAFEILSLSERDLLKRINRELNIKGGEDDWYELLIRIVCRKVLAERLEKLKLEAKKIQKLLKTK